MNDVIIFLEKQVDVSKLHALEVFGRGGDWHTTVYANKVKSLQESSKCKNQNSRFDKNHS